MTRSHQKERIPCRGAAVTVLFLMLSPAGAAAGDMPDAVRTPGWVNPDVTQDNIGATVCNAGWTKTIRPRTKYTTDLKIRQINEYGYNDKNPKNYEEDHLISLQLGGHPTDPRNLWPQPYDSACGARIKDVLETKLKRIVCAGSLTLAEAQRLIASDWISAYQKFVKPAGCGG